MTAQHHAAGCRYPSDTHYGTMVALMAALLLTYVLANQQAMRSVFKFSLIFSSLYESSLPSIAFWSVFLTIFRQVHGLVIVTGDEAYRREVDQHLSLVARGTAKVFLVGVLFVPYLILSCLVSQYDSAIASGGSAITVATRSLHLQFLYSLTLLFPVYAVWDMIVIEVSAPFQPGRGVVRTVGRAMLWPFAQAIKSVKTVRTCCFGDNYDSWARVRCALSVFFLCGNGLFFGLITLCRHMEPTYGLPKLLFWPFDPMATVPFLIIGTAAGYSLADYILNSRFYFR